MRGIINKGAVLAVFISVLLALAISLVRAAEAPYLQRQIDQLASPTPPAVPEPSFTQLAVKMFVVLLVIIGLIVLVGFGMRRLMKSRRVGAGKVASVVSVTHIVDRKYIAVVEVLGRTLILGVGSDAVTLLSDIGPAFISEVEESQSGRPASGGRDAQGFSDFLAERLSGMESAQASSFLETLTDQVKKKIARLKR